MHSAKAWNINFGLKIAFSDLFINGLIIVYTCHRPSSPNAFIGDPVFYKAKTGFPLRIAAGMTIGEP